VGVVVAAEIGAAIIVIVIIIVAVAAAEINNKAIKDAVNSTVNHERRYKRTARSL